MARTYDLLVRAMGDTSGAERAMKQLQRTVRNAGRAMTSTGRTLTMGLTAPIIAFAGLGVKEALETRTAMMKVDAVLKSMGKTAKVSRGDVLSLADQLERYSAIEGDLIMNAESVALSFKSLAGDPLLFKQTMRAAVDMSGALGQDLQTSIVQLGKAMQNGAKGAGALSRNGTLAKDDIAKLQDMAKKGVPLWKQQAFILDAVNKQYKGQGRNVDPMKRMMVVLKQTAEVFGTLLLPAIEQVGKWMEKVNHWVQRLSPAMQRKTGIVLLLAAALGPLLIVLGSVTTAVASLLPVIAAISPVVIGVVAAVGAVVGAFVAWYRHNEDFRNSVQTIGKALWEHKLAIASIMVPAVAVVAVLVKLYRRSELFRDILRAVGRAIGAVVTGIAQLIAAAITYAGKISGWVEKSGALRRSFDAVRSVVGAVASALSAAAGALVSIARDARDAGASLAGGLRSGLLWLKRNAASAVGGLSSALSAVEGVARRVASWIQQIVSKLESALAKMAKLKGLLPGIPGVGRSVDVGVKSQGESMPVGAPTVNQYFTGEPNQFAAAQSALFQFQAVTA